MKNKQKVSFAESEMNEFEATCRVFCFCNSKNLTIAVTWSTAALPDETSSLEH